MPTRIQIADFGAAHRIHHALAAGGITASLVDAADSPATGVPDVLILAFDGPVDQRQGLADRGWAEAIQAPLDACFALLKRYGTMMREAGGLILAALPAVTLESAGGGGSEAVLHRSVLGLMEGLRAEWLAGEARVSILFTGAREGDVELGKRLASIMATRAMYSLPDHLNATNIEASFSPLLAALAATPVDPRLPPAGPMGEVYRSALTS